MSSFEELSVTYSPPRVGKDNAATVQYLRVSAANAEAGDYYKALEFCNKALCFAEKETVHVVYLERAQKLKKMERYKEALLNIKMSLQSEPPFSLYDLIHNLEYECRRLQAQQVEEPPSYKLKLSSLLNHASKWVSPWIRRSKDESMGTGIFAKKDLKPLELVAVEAPFAGFVLHAKRYVRCAYCLKENYFTMIPCDRCTITMFCGFRCRSRAMEEFHDFECSSIDALLRIFDKMNVGLHMVYKYFTMFLHNESARRFFRNGIHRQLPTTSYWDLATIEDLETHETRRESAAEKQHYDNMASALEKYLLHYTPIKDKVVTDQDERFFKDLVRHFAYSTPVNAFDLAELNAETEQMELYGAAFYPFCSQLNHSCTPNATLVYQKGKCCLYVTRPITATEQLFISYGPNFLTDEKIIRQRVLKTIYNFDCKCEACERDYPIFSNLTSSGSTRTNFKDLRPYSYSSVRNYKRYKDFLFPADYKSYPCIELCTAEESLKIELNIYVGAVGLANRGRFVDENVNQNLRKPVTFTQEYIDEDEGPFRKAFSQSCVRKFFQANKDRTSIFEDAV